MKISPIRLLWMLSVLLLNFYACKDKKNNDDPPPVEVEFPGIVFTDEMGNHLGNYGGTDDNDWKRDLSWPSEVDDLMKFPDTVQLSGTYLDSAYVPGQDLIQFHFFPNPVHSLASVYIILPGHVKVKLALVDHFLKPVMTKVYLDSDTSWVWLDLSDTSQFVEGEVYRMYYILSAEGNEDFYKGHGDILKCRELQFNCVKYIE